MVTNNMHYIKRIWTLGKSKPSTSDIFRHRESMEIRNPNATENIQRV